MVAKLRDLKTVSPVYFFWTGAREGSIYGHSAASDLYAGHLLGLALFVFGQAG
jgi:hypothetical protein